MGPDQEPGAVVMMLTSAEQLQAQSSPPSGVLDPSFKRLVVVFNCSPLAQVRSRYTHVSRDEGSGLQAGSSSLWSSSFLSSSPFS
jgi:hypothetical protein